MNVTFDFHVLKFQDISSRLIFFDHGIFRVTLSPVEYLTVEYSTFKTFEKAIITINLDALQISKQIYRKHKYRENVFEEFQRLPCFPRKMVLYSSTKFGLLKQYFVTHKIQFRRLIDFKTNL